jgi:hypothetical protein
MVLAELVGVLECWSVGCTPVIDLLISVDGGFSKASDLFWTKVIFAVETI